MVDNPYLFGEIAAANALSDVYAMGGKPVTALNMVGFPACLDVDILIEILRGGSAKILEAGAVIAGGHSVEDEEPKYGLAVTGLVDPRRMVTTVGCRQGDELILTKPLGTGLISTGLKGEFLKENEVPEALEGMATLNRYASEIMLEVGVSACTDITGFGLLGHALEMAEASGVSMVLNADIADLPIYPRAMEMAEMGLIPVGGYRNRDYYLPKVSQAEEISPDALVLLTDPQTSGGLLMAVPPEKTAKLCSRLEKAGCGAYRVGYVEKGPAGTIRPV